MLFRSRKNPFRLEKSFYLLLHGDAIGSSGSETLLALALLALAALAFDRGLIGNLKQFEVGGNPQRENKPICSHHTFPIATKKSLHNQKNPPQTKSKSPRQSYRKLAWFRVFCLG